MELFVLKMLNVDLMGANVLIIASVQKVLSVMVSMNVAQFHRHVM
jgi:hypothetical protein